ncbi:MAG: hypothetical protein M3Y87_01460 [Myxococcota bacterium]|nr:hypothetical protein [Myxococcota bacterium]
MRASLRLGFVVACGIVAAGCGGKECGEGTVDMGGRCVPTSEITCGEGTTLDETTGMCVADGEVTCGAGTMLDADTGMCVADGLTCATGTVAMGGECVPDGSVICVGNTVFDMDTGTCVLDEGACAEGTVLLMGRCVAYDDSLIADIHAGGEPDDPIFFDGTVTVFTPPAIGETVTIDGCITPANFDGDDEGTIDFDLDFFNFSVSRPGLYNMRVDGLNGASAAFAVLSPDPELAGWMRIGIDLTNDGADRQIWLPREGQYYIAIFDSRSIALDTLQTQFAFARAVGSADTCYFMSFEALPAPTPVALTGETRTGRIGDPQFFTTPRTGVVQANLEAEGFTLLPAVVLTDGTEYQNGAGSPLAFSFSPVVTEGETLTVVVDNVFDYSLRPVEYTLRVFDLPVLPEDGVVELPYVSPDDLSFLYFEAAAGDVLQLSWAGGGLPIGMGIFAPDLTLITQPPAGAASYTQLRQGGRYIIGVLNVEDGFTGETFPISYTSRIITPAALTTGTAGTVMLDGPFGFARIDASAVEWPIFTLANLMGTGFANAEVFVFDGDERGLLQLPRTGAFAADVMQLENETTSTGFERIWGTSPGGVLIAVRDVGTADRDETLELTLAEQMFADLTLAADTPVMRADVAVPAGGAAYYLARAAAGSPITITATGNGGANPVIAVLDREAVSVRTVDATGADAVETTTERATSSGWVAFAVSAGAAGGVVDVELVAGPPPYDVTTGTRTFTDICATGTTLVNGDDLLSAVRDFTTFTTFQYFGAGASRMRVSTNGWLTFDASYTGTSNAFGTLADGFAPDAVVAPHWADLVARVCISETAAETIVQWTGIVWNTTISVQMQTILHADGRIEIVYGPTHDAVLLEGQVGLESRTGDYAIAPSLAMVGPSRSVLFTPN